MQCHTNRIWESGKSGRSRTASILHGIGFEAFPKGKKKRCTSMCHFVREECQDGEETYPRR
jgi:hypothetical protein